MRRALERVFELLKKKANGKEAGKAKRKEGMRLWPLYLALFVLLALYALHNSAIIGAATLVLIVAILVLEARTSISKEGGIKSLIDVAIALLFAAALWFAFTVALATPVPFDAIASCSMQPVLHRGDIVVLQGVRNMSSFLKASHVPIVNVSNASFSYMLSHMSREFVAFYAYSDANKSTISNFIPLNASRYSVGLYSTTCLSYYSSLGQSYNYYRCYLSNSSQQGNLIRYDYSIGRVMVNGKEYGMVETSSIFINGTKIIDNYSNPIIVYRTTPNDTFSGDIIHRAVAAIHAEGNYYIITWGDNNPGPDIQFGNYPPDQKQVLGHVLLNVPYLGYFKLILSGQIGAVAGCNQVILHNYSS